LLLRLLLPIVRMPMSVPVIQSCVKISISSSKALNRRHLRAKDCNCFHQGSIRFNQPAYLRMN
jgi:hypothetical protein